MDRFVELLSNLFSTRFMVKFMRKFTCSTQVNVQFLNDMDWQADSTGLVHNRPFNRLTNPPCSVSGKAETAFRVKFFNCADQTQVTFLDQIQQCQSAITVAAGNFNHQTQVTFNHTATRRNISTQRTSCKINFLFCRKQRGITDLTEVQLSCVQHSLAYSLRQQLFFSVVVGSLFDCGFLVKGFSAVLIEIYIIM